MSLKSSICTQTCQRLDTMAFLLHNSPSVPCWGCRVVQRKHLSVVCGNSMIEDAGRIHMVELKESIWVACNISPGEIWRKIPAQITFWDHLTPLGFQIISPSWVKSGKKICEITTNSCQFRPSHSSTPEGLGSILHRTFSRCDQSRWNSRAAQFQGCWFDPESSLQLSHLRRTIKEDRVTNPQPWICVTFAGKSFHYT